MMDEIRTSNGKMLDHMEEEDRKETEMWQELAKVSEKQNEQIMKDLDEKRAREAKEKEEAEAAAKAGE